MRKKDSSFHENFNREEKVKISSEKSFGITFGFVFLILGIIPLFFQHSIRVWSLLAAGILFFLAFVAPQFLKYLNLIWAQFGLLLNKIISPIALFLLYFLAFVPTGLILKLFKKDILNLAIDRKRSTYWIKSDPVLSAMNDQF